MDPHDTYSSRVWVAHNLSSAERALTTLRQALDASVIVAITDAAGVITYANERFCTLSKYPREELVGKTHRIINSGYHSKAFWQAMWDTLQQGQCWHAEVKNRAKDGSLYWVDTHIIPVYEQLSDMPTEYVAIRYDITDRKLMEAEIRELNTDLEQRVQVRTAELEATLAKLKKTEAQRETFISALTHDLRTPLVAEKRALEILSGQTQTLSPKLIGLVERLQHSNDDLLLLVNKLLDAYNYNAGQVSLEHTEVSLAGLIGQCFDQLRVLAEAAGIAMVLEVPEVLPPVWGDASHLKRLFMNLLANGIQHVPAGGNITVSAVLQMPQEATGPGVPMLLCAVRDNGPGIPQEALPRLFDQYFVAHRTKKIGRGLGLSIAQSIAQLHGGSIGVESTVDEGTCFTVSLPVVRGAVGG